eukprot:g19583.t1
MLIRFLFLCSFGPVLNGYSPSGLCISDCGDDWNYEEPQYEELETRMEAAGRATAKDVVDLPKRGHKWSEEKKEEWGRFVGLWKSVDIDKRMRHGEKRAALAADALMRLKPTVNQFAVETLMEQADCLQVDDKPYMFGISIHNNK